MSEVEYMGNVLLPAEIPENFASHYRLSPTSKGMLNQMCKGDIPTNYKTLVATLQRIWRETNDLHEQEVPTDEKPNHRKWRTEMSKQARLKAEEGRKMVDSIVKVLGQWDQQLEVAHRHLLAERDAVAREALAEQVRKVNESKKKKPGRA